MNISGSRIDKLTPGYELTYFGEYQGGLESQTIFIRNRVDLVDIRDQISKVIEGEEAQGVLMDKKAQRVIDMIKREKKDAA